MVGHIEEIAHPSVKLCLDIGHGFIAANVLGFDLAEGLRRAQPYIRHLHLHDNFGLYNPNSGGKIINSLPFGFGDLHRAPGDGSIPYAALTDDIRACEAVALVELNPLPTPERLRRMLGDLKSASCKEGPSHTPAVLPLGFFALYCLSSAPLLLSKKALHIDLTEEGI